MVSALVPVARASSPIRIALLCSCYKVHMFLRLERCKESGMGKSCCQTPEPDQSAHNNPRWRLILWIALIANAAMFVVEIVAGVAADSRAPQADALDSFGDVDNYALKLGRAEVWERGCTTVE